MAGHYVKLWYQLLKSSILDEDLPVRWLWIVLLLEADQEGHVFGTPEALSRSANLPLDQTLAALKKLQEPDQGSSTQDDEGRRLANPRQNVWYLINYEKYREIRDVKLERAKHAERTRRWRERRRLAVTHHVTPVTVTVTRGDPTENVDVDVDGKRSTEKTKKPVRRLGSCPPYPTSEEVQEYLNELGERAFSGADFVDHYQGQGWLKKNKLPVKDWRATVRDWHNREVKTLVRASDPKTERSIASSGVCPRCGHENPDRWIVCAQCMMHLGTSQSEIEAMRSETTP